MVEGWATGVSVHVATSKPVVIAFDSGNLAPVAVNLKQKFTNNQIIIAGDSDAVGKQKAQEAAASIGSLALFPEFPEAKQNNQDGNPCTDFNDLHQVCDLDEVKKQLGMVASKIPEPIQEIAKKALHKNDPCGTFSIAYLPPILRAYIESICETTNAHPIMITGAVLGMVSAFIGKRAFISEDVYFQKLYPNLWIINIADSGQFKSTALNKGAKLAWERAQEIGESTRSLRKELHLEDDQQKKREIKSSILEVSLKDVVLPNKITSEALLEHLSQGHSGIILTSELGGWLYSLEKSYNGDLKALFTELYDVPPAYRYKTRTQGDLILNEPYISICGVSTLPWLKLHIKEIDFMSGFFARFLIFAPPHKYEIPSALPTKQKKVDMDAEKQVRDVLFNMKQNYSYTLSTDAEKIFNSLHQDIYNMVLAHEEKCRNMLEPYVKRWSPYLLKLAIIMQLFLDPESTEIGSEALYYAYAFLIPSIKSTAALIEGELGESEHQRKCRKLYEWICKKVSKTGFPIKRQKILTSKQLKGDVKEYDYVLDMLIEQGKILYVEAESKNNSTYEPLKQDIEEIEKP